jgi:hypothetical protein
VYGAPTVFKTVCGLRKAKAMEPRAACESGITRARRYEPTRDLLDRPDACDNVIVIVIFEPDNVLPAVP